MARERRKKTEEDGAPPVGEWMVTFSDCMTLLLCFFVMMLSMSSFDDVAIDRLIGVCPSLVRRGSVFSSKRGVKDSLIPPVEAVVDWTAEGSEKPTSIEPENITNPELIEVLPDTEAYRDRKVIRISSVRVFHGNSCAISSGGEELLKLIASFAHRLPCQVIIGETSGSPSGISLERAWAVLTYLTETQGLPKERFSVSAERSVSTHQPEDRSVLEFVLLTRDLHR